MNIFSKENRSIADAAAKVMQQQPAVKQETAPKIIQSNMVDRVLATNMGTQFKREKVEESTKIPMAKKKTPDDLKTTDISASDGHVSEGNLEALQSDYAGKMPTPVQTTTNKKEKKVK